MDNWIEILFVLIFAAVSFFGKRMSEQSDEDGESKPPRRGASEQDSEAVERQRKIQEEIRRKIQERRQASEGGQAAPSQRQQPTAYDVQQAERRKTTEATQRHKPEVVKETQPQSRHQATPPPIQKTSDGAFSWDASDNVYESQMEQRLKQIEATKRKAEQLKKQAEAVKPKSSSSKPSRGTRTFSGPIRSQLKDPAAARAAFIYGEVLGQPISQRKQSSVPGLSS
ncbi:MAG TPA: hypothetical protein DCX06_06530 [Opitutae bacterium]|nr:hypothetical protein [Opitutae bacterium]